MTSNYNLTDDRLSSINNDISQCKSISENDRTNCEIILERASHAYDRLKIEFLQETLILIDEALQSSNADKLQQIHRAWSLQLQRTKRQCENIADPLIEVMQILSNSDQHNRRKYFYLLGGGLASGLLVGAGFGFFMAFLDPTSVISILGNSLLAGAGAFGLTLFVSNKKDICTQTSETSQTSSELAIKMKEFVDTFNITEDILRNHALLQSIKKSIENQLKN